MRKLAQSAIITTAEDSRAQLIQDSTNLTYRFVDKTAAGGVTILGPIPYGKTLRYTKTVAQKEFQNAVLIGGPTVEVVAASTRYALQIWNPEADYEGHSQGPLTYATTSPATLTSAVVDRTNVYTALVNKINAYAGNNCIAYGLTELSYASGNDANSATGFVIGEVVTQQTSNITCQVAALTITGGSFAAGTAAGKIWVYNLSTYTGWQTGAATLTAAGEAAEVAGISNATTNCVVTATHVAHYQGLVIVDDPGYFTSNKFRGGINRVGLVSGFAIATASVIIPGKYSVGVGTDMLAQRPVWDPTHQDLIAGNPDYAFANNALPVAGGYYTKYVFDVVDGDETALGADRIQSVKQYVLFFDQSTADYVDNLDTALATVCAL